MWAWLVIAAHINRPIIKNKSQKAEVKTTFVRNQTFCTRSAHGTTHGTIYMNRQSPTTLLLDAESHQHRVTLRHKKHAHKRVNSFPCSKFSYCRFILNPPSRIRQLCVAFFTSAFPPTLSMYTVGRTQCKVQAYTAVRNPHRSSTTYSHKQLPKV